MSRHLFVFINCLQRLIVHRLIINLFSDDDCVVMREGNYCGIHKK